MTGAGGSRDESYLLNDRAADAHKGRRVPEGLAAATASGRKTATGRRGRPPNQAAQDRSGPPARRYSLSLSDKEWFIAGYDRKQRYPDPAVDIAGSEAIGSAARQPLSTWDAGTGQFALPAALRFGQVIAVNVSPAMLGALAATGFEVTDVSYGRRLYGAYTCVKVG